MTYAYLLLDSSQIPDIHARLHQLAINAAPHALYLTTQYAELASCGPVLVAVEPDSPLAQAFAEQWQARAGIWLETDADEHTLIAHLRSLIHVKLEGGVPAFFRYYDPRITRLWLADLTAGERDRLMGPVCLIRLPDGLLITRQTPNQPGAQYADTPWLSLSTQQLEHLSQASRTQFAQLLITHCQHHFPQCLQALDNHQQLAWAQGCQRNAARQGYSAKDEMLIWVGLYAAFGDEFPDGPDQEAYRQLLSERDASPEQRLARLSDELTRQCVSGEITL